MRDSGYPTIPIVHVSVRCTALERVQRCVPVVKTHSPEILLSSPKPNPSKLVPSASSRSILPSRLELVGAAKLLPCSVSLSGPGKSVSNSFGGGQETGGTGRPPGKPKREVERRRAGLDRERKALEGVDAIFSSFNVFFLASALEV